MPAMSLAATRSVNQQIAVHAHRAMACARQTAMQHSPPSFIKYSLYKVTAAIIECSTSVTIQWPIYSGMQPTTHNVHPLHAPTTTS